MSITDVLEEKYNINLDDLNSEEKKTYLDMLAVVQESQITPEKLRDYRGAMREAEEQELIDEPEFNFIFLFKVPNRKQIYLKARLKNYILLESYLLSPEKAKEAYESMVKNLLGGDK